MLIVIEVTNFSVRVIYYFIMSKLMVYWKNALIHQKLIYWISSAPLIASLLWIFIYKRLRKLGYRDLFKNKKTLPFIIIILFFIISEFAFPIVLFHDIDNEIHDFVDYSKAYVSKEPLEVIKNTTNYVDSKINNSYRKNESALKIDSSLIVTDYKILELLGFDRAHVIFWQKWGSCYEHARATAFLLDKIGFETRIAHFIGRDHAWAEVKINDTWYIVDPWYISHYYKKSFLVPINVLANLPVSGGAYKVIVTYLNNTSIDSTADHGFSNQTKTFVS